MTTQSPRREFARTRATGAEVRAALQAAARWLSANADRVNALNVFPVPDGDTGTNMSLTLRAAVADLDSLGPDPTPAVVTRATTEAALLGARGNSGVILSQLLRGFAELLVDADELTGPRLGAALVRAAEVAHAGVSRPVEGTILTVARVAGAAARAAADQGRDLPGILEATLEATTDAVARTPDQLEVLKKAGVVDSGAEGYRVILEGAWMWSTGRSIEQAQGALNGQSIVHADLHDLDTHASSYGFCTEVLMRDARASVADLTRGLEALGDSILVVGDPDLMRLHVHTPRPGQVLEYAVDHGTVARVKVDNMQLQNAAFAEATGQPPGQPDATPSGGIGVIAVVAGQGLQDVFRSFGARVVGGGQTMNPSVQEILAAVNQAPYDQVVILPNNTNVLLTARQVASLTTTRTVSVVPTATAPQGIGAMLAFNYEADLSTNVEAMQAAARGVHTVEVTRAVRDTDMDGVTVHQGDMLGLYDDRIVTTAPTANQALLQACGHAPLDALEIVTIYHGDGASDADARQAAADLRRDHPALAVEVVAGGQPHYPYVVSLE